jgi:tripartite-type tricarboxylate transporter receptor subunit TctC
MMESCRAFSRTALSALLILCAMAILPAHAQNYPTKAVRIITQGAAGSGPDVIARIVADHLSRQWSQQVVVMPYPGAAGSTAARAAAAAGPDGYTLYMPATSAFIVMPEMFPNLPFDLDRDFARIGFIGEQPMMIAVAPSAGVGSLAEFIAHAKARPGEINFAANLRGSLPHLTVERLRSQTDINLTFIPYPGAPAGLQDLLGGRISMITESIGPLYGALQAGSIRPLAVAWHQRLPNFPAVPTVAETVPDFVAMGWFVLMTPAGTPESIVHQANQDLNKVLQQPELRQKFQDLGTFVRLMSSAETTAFVRNERQSWRPVVRQLGLTQP